MKKCDGEKWCSLRFLYGWNWCRSPSSSFPIRLVRPILRRPIPRRTVDHRRASTRQCPPAPTPWTGNFPPAREYTGVCFNLLKLFPLSYCSIASHFGLEFLLYISFSENKFLIILSLSFSPANSLALFLKVELNYQWNPAYLKCDCP